MKGATLDWLNMNICREAKWKLSAVHLTRQCWWQAKSENDLSSVYISCVCLAAGDEDDDYEKKATIQLVTS